jgi:pimeloyl-ACP methyl ester carboxylesterase
LVQENNEAQFKWLFLPGGPGLGSEYFQPFLEKTFLPGSIWRVDYPGDGSNHIDQEIDYGQTWRQGLVKMVQNIPDVILVLHSFSAIFALTIPELEGKLAGLILLDGAPSNEWLTQLSNRAKQRGLPDTTQAMAEYANNKSNDSYKKLTLAISSYYLNLSVEKDAKKLLESLPYSHATYDWANSNVHPNYKLEWIPQEVQTLIVSGEDDMYTPIELFQKDERFKRPNIEIVVIKQANHFPWFEQPQQTAETLQNFGCKLLQSLHPSMKK